ncbi:transcription termination factor NusA [Longimicrobium sp.]|uniref:transcription termination factor NusA n=1 Tax=Longimicrobium sp. TaxID=2029185 RepID=UPI002D0CA74F|nr:transcription termination factor NusA [Longimicrobium sp.]HSU13444.1 transcription termination factor NusA [Longimicrobium sp.]
MNNATQILAAFREMTANKAISRDELHDLIKDGILAALAKRYGPNVEAEIEIDEATGGINITVLREVVAEVEDPSRQISLEEARWDDPDFEVGDIMEVPVEFAQFGRNAVMAAKQRILQRVREGERQKIRDEYEHRVGELLSGEVQQVERGKLVVLLNRAREADAIVPWKEQNPRERFRQGETIRAVLKKVEETPKGPRLILSRADPLFVAALFKLEVPEIQQGIVDIRAVSREVGGRTKLAVSSRDESIDPVGACVGLKGSRVRAVVQELGGERIDIVPWHPDPEVFAKRALAPAKVAKVISDYDARTMTAIVDEDQLSLAIGRNGQNVRLASQLIGWQLDLYGSREWLEHGAERALFGGSGDAEESADFPVSELDLPPATLAALQAAGYNTFYDIIDLEREDLMRIPAIGQAEAERIAQLIEEMTVEEEEAEPQPVPEGGGEAVEGGVEEGDAGAEGLTPGGAA